MQASNLAQAGHAFFALTHSMNMHGRAAAMVTPIGDKKTLLPAESAVSRSGCARRGRVKRAARERTNGSTRGCRERSDAKVCASASVAEGARVRLSILPCFAPLSSPPAAALSHFSRTSLARLSHGCCHTMGSASRLYDDARKQSGDGFDDERTHSSGSSAPGSTRTG